MPSKVKYDKDPINDYSDGYSSGRRYWSRKLKALFSPKRKEVKKSNKGE